ncbi:hypothetical protein Cgig2_005297 [Carnegiea gigantea]|uniref:Uncharacterized protein n=1 Tax=Carnegiea gigantea TaxID=171969 RepID=A0A9Q1K1U5_9CARY|nr:hypothetical protein Cgig2_005297 [Carnegiea gigantea]
MAHIVVALHSQLHLCCNLGNGGHEPESVPVVDAGHALIQPQVRFMSCPYLVYVTIGIRLRDGYHACEDLPTRTDVPHVATFASLCRYHHVATTGQSSEPKHLAMCVGEHPSTAAGGGARERTHRGGRRCPPPTSSMVHTIPCLRVLHVQMAF